MLGTILIFLFLVFILSNRTSKSNEIVKNSNITFHKHEIDDELMEEYSNQTFHDFPKLVAHVKKLGFTISDLGSEGASYLIKALKITDTPPVFFMLSDNNTNIILRVKKNLFSFVGMFVTDKQFAVQRSDEVIKRLNYDKELNSIEIIYIYDNNYKYGEYYPTTPYTEYSSKVFDEKLILFCTYIKADMLSMLGLDFNFPEFLIKKLNKNNPSS